MGEAGGSKCFHLNCWQSNCARNSKTIPLLHLLSFFFREKSSVRWVLIHTLKEGWIKIHLKLDIPYYCSWRKKHKQQRKFYNSTLLLFIPPLYYFRITAKCLKMTKIVSFSTNAFSRIFSTHIFRNFCSRQIEAVNSQKEQNSCIFTIFVNQIFLLFFS